MASIAAVAEKFFAACESGRGWEGCQAYCTAKATLRSQAGALADVGTLQQYADWMKVLLVTLPDGRYEVKSFAVDERRNNVSAYAIFTGTHMGAGGPCPPTGKTVEGSDYVYVMEFDGDKIRHMTKIWPDTWALKQLGWA
jgi:predicted ester cyclase